MRLITTWCLFAALGCGSGQNDPGAAVACDALDPGLGRTLLSTSEPRKTGAWSDEMSSRVEAALRGECERTRWTRASYACLQGGVCDADATRQRDRARALAEATIHELDAAIAKGADAARPGAIGSPLPSATTDPDYPTPAAAGTDKIFSTEDPDRGPKVPVDFALPPKAELTWSDHAYCEDDRTNIVCSPDPAPKGQLWSWRLGKRGKELVVAESWRAGHLVQTFV
ncbi:MAG: hypothetical protein NT062_30080, partial [Proteobacteria bacterium]|nr:hypothetical protein [Pseudomonadota bacterium]